MVEGHGAGDLTVAEGMTVVGERPLAHIGPITRDRVLAIEEEMKKFPQLALATRHYFSQGVYAREIFIPKGTLLTGEIHKYEQLNIVSKGELSVLVDGEIQRIRAPFTVVSPPGTKRIAYAHEDTVWTTIHGTELRDVDAIRLHFIAKDEQEYLAFAKHLDLLVKPGMD